MCDSVLFTIQVTNIQNDRKMNPKKMQRDVRRQLASAGIGTKSQQALKLQQEQKKTERKNLSREKSEAEKQRRFDLKQQKRREKHKGH